MSEFYERIRNLSDQQRILLERRIGVGIRSEADEQNGSPLRLVAYVIADNYIEPNEIRESLKDKLPEYMIPSKFIQVEAFPTLPNGKIDLNALQIPLEDRASNTKPDVIAPTNETELQLVKIWEEVLDFHPIGVRDNFFEIGGDSILSIQIVSKARQKGIFLAPNQIFEHQTVSQLALFCKTEKNFVADAALIGNIPLLPIQHWFFDEHKNEPNHWNQAIMFDSIENVNSEILGQSVAQLIEYHDALRMRFTKNEDRWNSYVAQSNEVNAFSLVDLTDCALGSIASVIEEKSIEIQANLNLSESALFQLVFFRCGDGIADKIMLLAHHLVVDNISWKILISDLETIYQRSIRGETNGLPVKTTSYGQWGNLLTELSNSGEFDRETSFWKEQDRSDRIPVDFETVWPAEEERTNTISLAFDSETTESLIRNSNEAYQTKTEELLITALMLSFEKWAGIKNVCLGLEKHGRNFSKDGIDLSNTVGWFTNYFPVSLEIKDSADLKSSIVSTKEKLRSLSNDGIGYGILRYLRKVEGLNQTPQVIFNFLGNQKSLKSAVLGEGKFVEKGVRSGKSERHHLLEVNAFIEDSVLRLNFSFNGKAHKIETIQQFTEHFEGILRDVVKHCSTQETIGYSPADFPEADLNQDDLDNLLKQLS